MFWSDTVCVNLRYCIGPCLPAGRSARLGSRGAAAMPLSERTDRALEACYDAILVPTRWASALQLLAESFGAASCVLFDHKRKDSAAPLPMSMGHEAYADLWTRNQAHAPDPHVGPYLELCTSFMRAGWASALEHHLSTEEERRTLPYFQETARPARREWLAVAFFTVASHDWCFPLFRGGDRRPFYARGSPSPCPNWAARRQSRQSGRKVCCLRRHVETLALERVSCAAVVIDATGRATQMN